MILFFDTHYIIRRSKDSVFEFLSDFERYHPYLPEFHGSTLKTDLSPIAEGKVYWIGTEDNAYEFRTRVQVLEVAAPDRFVYEYTYHKPQEEEPLAAGDGPMPWGRARVSLSFEPFNPGKAGAGKASKVGTRVRATMQVFGVAGFFPRWKVSTLKTACARAQDGANANMVRVAENHIPETR